MSKGKDSSVAATCSPRKTVRKERKEGSRAPRSPRKVAVLREGVERMLAQARCDRDIAIKNRWKHLEDFHRARKSALEDVLDLIDDTEKAQPRAANDASERQAPAEKPRAGEGATAPEPVRSSGLVRLRSSKLDDVSDGESEGVGGVS